MYLLDTNLVSELRKIRSGKADRNVAIWADSVDANELYISAITVQELEIGVLLVERRDPTQGALLRTWLDGHVLPAFANRVLSVDLVVALRSAQLHVPDPRPARDCLIAATALVHGMTVVSRNTADFASTGVATLNPWLTAQSVAGEGQGAGAEAAP
jgi:predicted nucleic acid-binding protein